MDFRKVDIKVVGGVKGFQRNMLFFNRILAGFAVGALILVLAACGEKAKPKAPPPPQISAVTVHSATVPINYEYPGRVAGFEETEVRARVGGILLKRNFIEGDKVREGQVLFDIDPTLYEAEVVRQKGMLAQAKANYAQSVLDADRAQALWEQKYQSTAYRDQMFAKRDVNKAMVEQAAAQLHQAEVNLGYTKVTAPISGMTGLKHVSEGSLIAADSNANLLTTITQTDPVYINFSYSGSEAAAIRNILAEMRRHNEQINALKVRIRFGDGTEYNQLGTVDFTSPTIDKTTGTLGVRAIVKNPDGILVPGQFVRLILEGLDLYNLITIPEQALMQNSAGQSVYVVKPDDTIELRSVSVLRQLSDRSWVLESGREKEPEESEGYQESDTKPAVMPKIFVGLRNGERVVTEGQYRIGTILAALPKGMPLKVELTNLDGKNIMPPKEGAEPKKAEK